MIHRPPVRALALALSATGALSSVVGCSSDRRGSTWSTTSAQVACTTISGAGQQLTDGQGNVWTLSNGVVVVNGADAGYSANVVQLVEAGGQIYQENAAKGWWVWSGGTWADASDPTASCASPPSPDCTTITGAGPTIVDGQGNTWTIAGGVVIENGSDAGYSANVVELAYVGGEVYQKSSAGGWWGWSGGTWVGSPDPTANRCGGSGSSSGGCSGSGSGGSSSGGSSSGGPSGGTGQFRVVGGQLVDPSGKPFLARGINVYDSQMSEVSTGSSGAPLTSLFPGIDIVRLNVYAYDAPSAYQAFIDQLTPLGIVVELEDHTNGAGDAGGSQGTIYTGQQLSDELAWYSSVAAAYANNPYVWFGTDNEPSENPSAAALSTWQQQTYQAIRSAGNGNIVLLEMNCDQDPSTCGAGYDTSAYAGMTNVVWDMHYYGWLVDYSTDMNAIVQSLAQHAQSSQAITSADGTMPVVIGEYGPSTDGQSTDANGTEVVTAVDGSGYGSMAWHWDSGANDNLTNGAGSLTSFGQQVAQFIAQ